MQLRNIDSLSVKDQLGIIRLDLNVPIRDGQISDDTRIKSALPTLNHLIKKGAKLVICSHLGRPKGEAVPEYSLEPVGARLAELLGTEVVLLKDYLGTSIPRFTHQHPGKIILLENLRFYPEEEKGDQDFAKELSTGFDFYVNDAFGCVHRAHASVTALANAFEPSRRAAGLLLEREVNTLTKVKDNPKPPFTVIMGGAKVSDKIGVILSLLGKANNLLIGGAMAYTFLKFRGVEVGNSRVEEDKMDLVQKIYQNAESRKITIELPEDHVAADRFSSDATPINIGVSEKITDGLMGLDIGPVTIKKYSQIISQSSTILWNGPMGVFEWDSFAKGTLGVAEAVANAPGFTVVGGGDSVAAINKANLASSINHISTGGGASLEFLEGNTLPGIKPLVLPR